MGLDAEMITSLIPQTTLCATEAITQIIKLIHQEMFLCNRLAIARLNYTQEHAHYITQINSPEINCVYVMDYISQIDSPEINCVYQSPPDRGQSRKIRFSKFPGSGLKKIY